MWLSSILTYLWGCLGKQFDIHFTWLDLSVFGKLEWEILFVIMRSFRSFFKLFFLNFLQKIFFEHKNWQKNLEFCFQDNCEFKKNTNLYSSKPLNRNICLKILYNKTNLHFYTWNVHTEEPRFDWLFYSGKVSLKSKFHMK